MRLFGRRGRIYETHESLAVFRINRCELHAHSSPAIEPSHHALRVDRGQLGRLTKDQMQVSADREQLLRTKAEPRLADILSVDDVVRRPLGKGDRQKCD